MRVRFLREEETATHSEILAGIIPWAEEMAKDNEQMTMEEYLLSQLDTPVILKDGTMMTKPDGTPMTKQEAIATNILNQAMKGDTKAAQYIQNIQMRAKIMKKK